ncbi:capsular biosynthesis protein [Sphingomonas ginkgonis]|uniref:Capsular biosynthesis protein n=1 Tax=Sphingomonas ginkgonis TaxID=2315330 RepID=A0A429V8R8_9SPHN|nr:capsular biosynthesis protein [Sphingomonas ginkgonis]RST30373.1 capsular biosynthesis protein [Sphingomonas ginkgonis]
MSSNFTRRFLFLQGPPGPLFLRLAKSLTDSGNEVYRINLSGGDRLDWPEPTIDYRDNFSRWPVFIDKFIREHRITDVLMYGDCRPYHVVAHGIASSRKLRIHVLEEGYLRPDWMTLELDGVNARSRLTRNKQWIREQAKRLPPETVHDPITATFRRRARDSYWYYHYVCTGRIRYPHYRSHRPRGIIMDGFGWLWWLWWRDRRDKAAEQTLREIAGKPFFVFPLQLSGDYQIRAHSHFPDMEGAARYVIESFAANAPDDVHLLVKAHPLDNRFHSWAGFVRKEARRLKIEDRLHYVDGGDLQDMARDARGMVCVNSTSATLSLAAGVPVCAIGEAIYNLPGLTHQGHLDGFWRDPQPPEPGLFEDFRRVLTDQCLVRGGLASESAVTILVESMHERLLR